MYSYSQSDKDEEILVMEYLGPSLEELRAFCGGKFSMKTTLMIADQLVRGEETLVIF